jgi:hypothetical protein
LASFRPSRLARRIWFAYFRRASNTAAHNSSIVGIFPDACSRAISANIFASSARVGLFTGHDQSVILQPEEDGPDAAMVYHDGISEGKTVWGQVLFNPRERGG